jgi:hypothetical protein
VAVYCAVAPSVTVVAPVTDTAIGAEAWAGVVVAAGFEPVEPAQPVSRVSSVPAQQKPHM